ncbi:MAG TPA: PEGA domain-containing protein [Bryobacteraceae bacterium]|nr:PEGA domain-containing protein [Bryobacteraceae bacterium]
MSNPALLDKSLAWSYPGSPLRILLSLRVIEGLRTQIATARGLTQAVAGSGKVRAISGALIGLRKSRPGVTNIVDFVPAPGDPNSSQLNLPSVWLDEVSARCPWQYKVVGYYRVSTDDTVGLDAQDQALIRQRFDDPSSAVLVIGSGSPRSMAGFFCWNDGAVADSSLTFPFSASELASEGWPIGYGLLQERLAGLASPVTGLAARCARLVRRSAGLVARSAGQSARSAGQMARSVVSSKAALLALILLLALGGGFVLLRLAPNMRATAPPDVALHVERTGQSFVLSWDPSAAKIAAAKGANLEIREDGKQPTVLLLALTADQLHAGRVTYGSLPYSEKAQFRLRLAETSSAAPPEPSTAAISPVAGVAAGKAAPPVRPAALVRTDSRGAAPPNHRQAALVIPPSKRPALAPDRVARASAPPDFQLTVASPAAMPEPPSIGRLLMPPSTVPFVLAGSLPRDRPAPPRTVAWVQQPAVPSWSAAIAASVPGLLTITSEPSGASVDINQTRAGSTPIALQISPVGLGFTVTVGKAGFATAIVQSVAMDKPYSLHARLRPQ